MEELCLVREFIDRPNQEIFPHIVIVSSEFFVDRTKVYAEYIFKDLDNFTFVASKIEGQNLDELRRIEEPKQERAVRWLVDNPHQRGDYQTILKEVRAFQAKVVAGEVEHPISAAFKLKIN